MDIAGWLRRLGLEQYEPAFRENDIDGDVLLSLTAADLRDLGIASVGHRRRLLDAIKALPRVVAAPKIETGAERRQLTVMFCDLAGSTALSSRLDLEDLRDVLAAYHKAVAEVVARFDGYVAKFMGDGVLIYFGYPQAHEDDAERAARAGLALVERIGRLQSGSGALASRIGIATGLVVVGDLIGTGDAQERGIVGETPNLAARLQEMAPANGMIIAEATRRLLGNLFECRDLGPAEVKGLDAPVSVWQVLRPGTVGSRFEALRSAALSPLVGRDAEIELLLRRWERAKEGEGQIVLISGEPGIGKSRLTAALQERLAGEPHIRLRYFCSPHHHDSALYPFIAQLEHAAGCRTRRERHVCCATSIKRSRTPPQAGTRGPSRGCRQSKASSGRMSPSLWTRLDAPTVREMPWPKLSPHSATGNTWEYTASSRSRSTTPLGRSKS